MEIPNRAGVMRPGLRVEQVCEAGRVSMWGTCAFKVRAGHKCGRPAVGHRDLVGQYPKGLTRQAVCELHQRAVDHKPPPLAHPDAPRSEAP